MEMLNCSLKNSKIFHFKNKIIKFQKKCCWRSSLDTYDTTRYY